MPMSGYDLDEYAKGEEMDRSSHLGEHSTTSYAKPEVVVLGDAKCTIAQTRRKAGLVFDLFNATHTIAPAYDLDD